MTAPLALHLKPAPAGGETNTDAAVGICFGRASSDLSRTNYTSLNADGKAQ